MRHPLLVPALLVGAMGVARAQEPDTALAERVRRLEDLVVMLRNQVAGQAELGVVSRQGNQLELAGTVFLNGFYNDRTMNNSDVPQVVSVPDPADPLPVAHVAGSARQTRLQLFAFAPGVLGGNVAGELDFDFYGGQQPSGLDRTAPLVRLRRFRADLVWRNAWIAFGQEAPPIVELNPSSFAALGLPEYARSGNLWAWLPQFRLGAATAGSIRFGAEAAVVAPTQWVPQGLFSTRADAAERSGRPFFQGRVLARWGEEDLASEFSLGGHLGWIAIPNDSLATTKAVAAALHVALGRHAEVRGEAFAGQSLDVLAGGGVGQNLGPGNVPIRTKGGWGQINLFPAAGVELGGGFGIDDPDNTDIDPVNGFLQNQTISGHIHWLPRPLLFAVEYRRIGTTYPQPTGRLWGNHFNVAAGFTF
jgi:hypothetical protein